MKPRFKQLSRNIYQNIHDTLKFKCINPHLFKQIHDPRRLEKYENKAFYYDNNNRTSGEVQKDLTTCYDGYGQSVLATKITRDYLNSNTNSSIFNNIKIYHHEISCYEALEKRSQAEHMFLRAGLKDNSREYIIDPTYKQLFIKKYGDVQKFDSSYATYLYNLPPVFIGTEEELSKLKSKLRKEKSLDFFHEHDNYIDNWHSESKEFDPDKLDEICTCQLNLILKLN